MADAAQTPKDPVCVICKAATGMFVPTRTFSQLLEECEQGKRDPRSIDLAKLVRADGNMLKDGPLKEFIVCEACRIQDEHYTVVNDPDSE